MAKKLKIQVYDDVAKKMQPLELDGDIVNGVLKLLTDLTCTNEIFKIKTADESVTSSTTLQDDDHLFFTLLDGEIWEFEFFLIVGEPMVNPDFRLSLAGKDGLTANIEYSYHTYEGSSEDHKSALGVNSGTIGINPSGTKEVIVVKGAIEATADGTLQLQWAQGSSDTDPITVHKLSTLKASKIVT